MTFEFRSFRLELRFSFFALLSLMLLVSDGNIALLCFAASMLHETGHLVCLCLFSGGLKSVAFGAGGIVMERNEGFCSAAGETAVALGGIAVNAFCCVLSLAVWHYTEKPELLLFAAVNAVLGLLNLMPVRTLDAWHALRIILSQRLPEGRMQQVLSRVSNAATIGALGVSLCLFFIYSFNISLAAVCVYLIILNRKRSSTDVSK